MLNHLATSNEIEALKTENARLREESDTLAAQNAVLVDLQTDHEQQRAELDAMREQLRDLRIGIGRLLNE